MVISLSSAGAPGITIPEWYPRRPPFILTVPLERRPEGRRENTTMEEFLAIERFLVLTVVEIAGYIGGAITVWAMYGKTIIPLRIGVVCGNVVLIMFGILGGSIPTVALHGVLLPLNAFRLYQMIMVVRKLHHNAHIGGSLDIVTPFMKKETVRQGTELFHKDDISDRIIVIESGAIRLDEINVTIGPGDVLGEIGVFTPDNKRTATALCETDCVLHTLSYEMFMQLYYQNPEMGMALVRIIVGRLLQNWKNADDRARALGS